MTGIEALRAPGLLCLVAFAWLSYGSLCRQRESCFVRARELIRALDERDGSGEELASRATIRALRQEILLQRLNLLTADRARARDERRPHR